MDWVGKDLKGGTTSSVPGYSNPALDTSRNGTITLFHISLEMNKKPDFWHSFLSLCPFLHCFALLFLLGALQSTFRPCHLC